MHFHLPKPLHGWRELIGEVGIIVVGVLIALAAEQVVEGFHERSLRNEARTAIDDEISQNMDAFRRRAEVQQCINARLRDVETLITTSPLGASLPRPLWIGRPQVWAVNNSRLTAATSGARTALLSAKQQGDYAEVYSGFRDFDQAQDIEQLAWARLRTLETLPSLDPVSRWNLIEALHEARYANFRILIATAQTQGLATGMGITTKKSPYEQGSMSICIPMNTKREDALKMTIKGRAPIAEP